MHRLLSTDQVPRGSQVRAAKLRTPDSTPFRIAQASLS
jgi:hypothetical protein